MGETLAEYSRALIRLHQRIEGLAPTVAERHALTVLGDDALKHQLRDEWVRHELRRLMLRSADKPLIVVREESLCLMCEEEARVVQMRSVETAAPALSDPVGGSVSCMLGLDAVVLEWATSKNFKIMNTQFQKKAGRRWTWRSPDGNTKNEIDYIMTDNPSMVTDVTVINRVNIGSDHRMVMCSITLNTRAERRKLLNKNTRTSVDTQMTGTKKNTFQLELKNRFTALEEHDDMDSLNKNMTEMIQQSALSIAKQSKKQKNPKNIIAYKSSDEEA